MKVPVWFVFVSLMASPVWAEGLVPQTAPADVVVNGQPATDLIVAFQSAGIPSHQPTHGQNQVLRVDLFCWSHPAVEDFRCILQDKFSDQGEPVSFEPIDLEGARAEELMNQLEAAGVAGTIPDHAPYKFWNHEAHCESGAAQFDRCRFVAKPAGPGRVRDGSSSTALDAPQSPPAPMINFTERAVRTACAVWGCTDDDVAVTCPLDAASEVITCTVTAAELEDLVMTVDLDQQGQLKGARATVAGERARDRSMDEAQSWVQRLARSLWGDVAAVAGCQKMEWDAGFLWFCHVSVGASERVVMQLESDLKFMGLEVLP